MKFSSVLILAAVASTSNALAPPANRRAFITRATTTAASFTAASIVTSSPAFAKDDYSLDTGDVAVTEKKAEKNSKGSNIVAGALAGSVLLSVPFFLPNLMRLAGINNAKNPDKK
jgi:hypothetical protein